MKKQNKTTSLQILLGIIPVNIEIENYRNFKKENIDFKDIVFCLINGKNGSGKSSIIDAIHDCLYEETREKDIMGWINNKEEQERWYSHLK